MRLYNHVVGGFVTTAVVSGLSGVNILQSPWLIAATLVCTVLPDIDSPQSPLTQNRILRPLSIFLFRKFGHRTLTHSIIATIAVTIVGWACGFSPVVISVAYFSHLFLDSFTKQGVPLLYPIMTPFYMIPNREKRMKTGGNGEYIAFGIFGFAAIGLYPLATDGFWTTYNREFATMKTTYSEFLKSADLLEVEYSIQTGSQIDTFRGLLVDAPNEDHATVWSNGKFLIVDGSKQIVKHFLPSHTGKRFYIHSVGFVGISADSLNNLLRGQKVVEISADGSKEFLVTQNGISQKLSKLDGKWIERLAIQSLDVMPRRDSVFRMPNFEAERLKRELENLRLEYVYERAEFENTRDELAATEAALKTNLGNNQRDEAMKRRDELRTKVRAEPKPDIFKKAALETQLRIVNERYELESQQKQAESEMKFQEEIRKNPPTQFVGFLKYLVLE